MLPGGSWGNLAGMTVLELIDENVTRELATWGLRMTPEQEQWFMDRVEILPLRYAYQLDFVEMVDGRPAVRVHRYMENAQGHRFVTDCPHGKKHAALWWPSITILDELPADDILYAPEPTTHRFDDEA